jgi:flagellar M-ring protein FliF
VQNILTLWANLDMRRRIIILGATAAMFLAVLGLSRMATTPEMSLLYAGLDTAAAGDVITALDQRGVAYQIAGDSIRVDASLRDQLRMSLAADGLPATGGAGYELLDGLSGFGTTSQMFDAAYWRAKEGELARTILASAGVRAARVHLAQAPARPFQRDIRPTASVTITSAGVGVTGSQASAFRHLVAAAVSGMHPEDVAIIDSVAGLVPSGTEASLQSSTGESRATELKRNLERLLAARVGVGRAIVEVSVDLETQSESVVERRFEPDGRVAISSDTEEKSNSSTQPGGQVTVASNLPTGDAAAGDQGRSNATETRERVNYEVSETKREITRNPGGLRRLSIAVLVDGERVANPDGVQTWQPRSDAELQTLRELVASAAGLDEARGDVLTLKSLPFEPFAEVGTAAEPSLLSNIGPIDMMTVIQLAALSFVALILGLFVVRPLLLAGQRRDLTSAPETRSLPAAPNGLADAALPQLGTARVLTGEIDDSDMPEFPMMSFGGNSDASSKEDPVTRLRRLIDERQAESVEILRGWMEQEEKTE